MSPQNCDGENRNRYSVPVEQADVTADVEVCEEGHREIAVRVQRHSARYVAGGCAEKNRKQEIGADENEIPIRLPKAIIDVAADFERDTAQNQTPQNQKEGEIVTSKSRSHQARGSRSMFHRNRGAIPHAMSITARSQR